MKIIHSLIFLIFLFVLFTETKAEAARDKNPLVKSGEGQKKICNLSEGNKFFTGREREIEDISRVLENAPILVIEGISGIGKSQLAKRYAHSNLNRYELVWWFDSDKNMEMQIDELLHEVFRRENRPYYRPASLQDLIKKLKHELADFKASWLLIFDNIEDMASMNQYEPFKKALKSNDTFQKHVIVTHKKMNNIYPALMIDKLQRNESLSFLSKILKEEKEEDLNQLAQALEDIPLALVQATSYIKMNPTVNIRTYLELLKENPFELWKAEEKLIKMRETDLSLNDNYNKSMVAAIKININFFKEHSPLAYDILCFCSLFHHQHIPFEVIEAWACGKRNASKLKFHEALSLLLNYIVLEQEKKTENKSKLFNQHELIQLVTLDSINTDVRKIILNEAADYLLQSLLIVPETLQEQFKGNEHFYNHIEKICDLAEKLSYNDSKINALKIAMLYSVHFMQHDFIHSAQLIKDLKDLPAQDPMLSPLAQLWLYSTIINDQIFEDFTQVQQYYSKAIECLKNIQDEETKRSYLLHVTTNFIESLSNIGKLKEAIVLCDSLTEVLNSSKNKSQKIAFLGIAAHARLRYGQYKQSLADLDYCLQTVKEQKNLKNYIPFFMVTKAHSLFYNGEIEKAYQIVEEYYPHLLEIFASPECAVLVNIQLIRGACLIAFGRLDEALLLVKQSLHSYEKSSGFENDSLKGMGYRILGEIFEAKGEFLKAYTEYKKAENFYEKILQEKSLDDLSLLYTRLSILGAKQGDDRMLEKYLSLHIENFGLTHPRTFKIKKFLDERGLSSL
ncbi:MAG: ATP-binding protein [Alphaproteobacteria bacterium]|nr:ATP-binding protein [Alphaproteobacteria bacterium]